MNYKELCLLVAVLAALFNTILSLLFIKKKKKDSVDFHIIFGFRKILRKRKKILRKMIYHFLFTMK